jgi:radical SAM superfamily enzyme YgiQ (UPF0313 family)
MIALINPNLVAQSNDLFTTGIVYMPITLAYVAASLRKAGIAVKVIDAFGQKTHCVRKKGNFLFLGLNYDEIVEQIPPDTLSVFIYAINLTSHLSTIGIIKAIRQARPNLPIVVLENTQSVTAYALRLVEKEFYEAGADYILTGESDYTAVQLVKNLQDGSAVKEANRDLDKMNSQNCSDLTDKTVIELDSLPFPAWDLFPLENYWKLRFAHGPQTKKRYLPLLTSRGCPYPCRFCVIPNTNNQKWRGRSAKNVVDEIEYSLHKYNVREFHIEDLNPTVSDARIREICNEILKRRLNVIWKIVAGTKAETIRSEETVKLMAKSGCRYISISPETGSSRLLKLMRKPFDLNHTILLVKQMHRAGIRSQACFVLGYPGENKDDLRMTQDLVQELTKYGVDEIALFIVTPVPGSAIYEHFSGYQSLSELNFTPVWRKDYRFLSHFRMNLYMRFLLWKLRYHPLKIIRQPFNFLRRRFETKMEMIPYKALVFKWLSHRADSIKTCLNNNG